MLRLLITCLTFLLCIPVPHTYAGEVTVKGRFMLENGRPLAGGQVFFFDAASGLNRPVLNKFWRVPDFAEQILEDGSFAVVLPTGTYYIAAIKRMSDAVVGPPGDGDYFLPSHDKKGTYRIIMIKDEGEVDLGTIKGIQRYSSRQGAYNGKVTAIEGKLIKEDGTPVEGMYVFAYTDPSMQGRPQFVSFSSNREGTYRLLVDKGRIVYLKTREAYAGGSPQSGAPIGVYGGINGQKPVAVRTNSILRGIDIVVTPFAQRVN